MLSIHTLFVCVLVPVGLFAPAHALDFCTRAEDDCQSQVKTVVHTPVKSSCDELSVTSDLIQDITQLNVSCKNLMGKLIPIKAYENKNIHLMSLNYSSFLCRETPRRWSQRELCSHCKELHILQIYSQPTERPTEAGSTFKGGVMTVTSIGTFYDRRSIWNITYSTGCGWGYPERGRECSPDGWVPAVRQWWQGAARMCSACTQIRRSPGRVCDHIWAIRHKKWIAVKLIEHFGVNFCFLWTSLVTGQVSLVMAEHICLVSIPTGEFIFMQCYLHNK